jgi:energy-converting hydrogenase Eha subunit C
VKSVLANIELVIGLLMMGFILPLLHPRYWQQAIVAFILVAIGAVLLVDGFRRVLRYENDKKDK